MSARAQLIVMDDRVDEASEVHTQLLRVSLEVEHSRAYWRHADPSRSLDAEAELAFREYWFGARSMARVRSLLMNFRTRFAPFPGALQALQTWASTDRLCRTLVCHWHLQLTDPIYRAFTGSFLPERRASGRRDISRDPVVRWVGSYDRDNRWGGATRAGFASKLLSAAHRAGLIHGTRDPRPLLSPRVPPDALGYLLYLLRGVRFSGDFHDNPYLRSVGLEGGLVDDKMRQVDGLTYRRIGSLVDITWAHDDLVQWVRSLEGRSV